MARTRTKQMNLFGQPVVESAVETFSTGAVVNMIFGILSVILANVVIALPSELKTIAFWGAGLFLVFLFSYYIQRQFRRKHFSKSVLVLGIAVGLFVMITSTSLVTFIVPAYAYNASLQANVNTGANMFVPALLGAVVCFALAFGFILKRK